MRRREFVILIAGAAISLSRDAQAKEPARLAFLGSGAAESSAILLEGLKAGLHENGLIESKDYLIDVRWANGAYERFPAFAQELAQNNPRVILVTTIAAARAAQQLVPPIPVVMTGLINPVDAGLIKSLARPGGNTTGVSSMIEDITTKSLEFLVAMVPKASIVVALYNPANPTNRPMFAEAQRYAAARGLKLQGIEFKSPAELDATFEEVKNVNPDALLIISDATLIDLRERIAALALPARLPTASSVPGL